MIWYSRENQCSVIKQDYLFNVTSFETKVLSSLAFNVAAKKEVELFVDHMFIVCKDIRMQPVSDQVDQCSHQFPAIKNSARNNNVSIHRSYFLSLARSFSFNERQGKKLKTEISKGFFYGPPVLSKLKQNNATQFQCYLFRLILVILDQWIIFLGLKS